MASETAPTRTRTTGTSRSDTACRSMTVSERSASVAGEGARRSGKTRGPRRPRHGRGALQIRGNTNPSPSMLRVPAGLRAIDGDTGKWPTPSPSRLGRGVASMCSPSSSSFHFRGAWCDGASALMCVSRGFQPSRRKRQNSKTACPPTAGVLSAGDASEYARSTGFVSNGPSADVDVSGIRSDIHRARPPRRNQGLPRAQVEKDAAIIVDSHEAAFSRPDLPAARFRRVGNRRQRVHPGNLGSSLSHSDILSAPQNPAVWRRERPGRPVAAPASIPAGNRSCP